MNYQHSHYDFPKAFGESDINSFSGTFATQLGRVLDLIRAGRSISGGGARPSASRRRPRDRCAAGRHQHGGNVLPEEHISAVGCDLSAGGSSAPICRFSIERGATAGNGVYLTSRQDYWNRELQLHRHPQMELFRQRRVLSTAGNRTESATLMPSSQAVRGVTYALTRPIQLIGQVRCPPSGNRQWWISPGQLSCHASGFLSARAISRSPFIDPRPRSVWARIGC